MRKREEGAASGSRTKRHPRLCSGRKQPAAGPPGARAARARRRPSCCAHICPCAPPSAPLSACGASACPPCGQRRPRSLPVGVCDHVPTLQTRSRGAERSRTSLRSRSGGRNPSSATALAPGPASWSLPSHMQQACHTCTTVPSLSHVAGLASLGPTPGDAPPPCMVPNPPPSPFLLPKTRGTTDPSAESGEHKGVCPPPQTRTRPPWASFPGHRPQGKPALWEGC